MRLYPTRAEHRAYLAIRGYTKIMRQYVAYPYIIDFYLPEWRVGIEIDGPVHWHRDWYDDKRSAYLLKTYNINIYRFEHDEEGLPRFMHDLWMEHRKHA